MTQAYGEGTATNSPNLKYVDWKRSINAEPVKNPRSEGVTIEPKSEKLIFDGSRTLTLDGTTSLALTLSPLDPSRYRFSYVSGTALGLRTARALVLANNPLTLTALANGSLTVEATEGSPFVAVQVGDTVFVPGASTGDSGLGFNVANEGFWTVIGVTGARLTLARLPGEDFVGASESVEVLSEGVLAFSAAGVQVGDKVEISAGFSDPVRSTFEVVAVTSAWFEVVSTAPLAAETASPGAAGLAVYTSAKRFVRVEVDQECVVRVNGDTGNSNRVSPWAPADPVRMGEYVKAGPTWALKVYNRSTVPAKVNFISVE